MRMNLSLLLFLTSSLFGIVIILSSVSWFSAWMGLELSLLSFLPLVMASRESGSAEAGLKYFLLQAMASLLLLQSSLFLENISFSFWLIMFGALLTKMGMAPFHMWFPMVAEGLSWGSVLLLFTVQKLGPLVLLFYCFNFNLVQLYLTTVILGAAVGAIGGLNETRFRKVLSFSSISHGSWMLLAMSQGNFYYLLYFCLYSIVIVGLIYLLWRYDISHINQLMSNKLGVAAGLKVILNLMSLGGLPPLFGFLPKWIVIQSLSMSSSSLVLMSILGFNLVTIYYYLRAGLTGFVFTGEVKMSGLVKGSNILENMLMMLSLTGLWFGGIMMVSFLQ